MAVPLGYKSNVGTVPKENNIVYSGTEKVETNIKPIVANPKAKSAKEEQLIALNSLDIIGFSNGKVFKSCFFKLQDSLQGRRVALF